MDALEPIKRKIYEIRGRRVIAFTREGVAMLSGLLRSEVAIQANINTLNKYGR